MKKLILAIKSGVLIAALGATLSTCEAQSSQSGSLDFTKDKILIVVGVAVVAVVVTAVLVHSSSAKRTITGCVSSGDAGIGITSDKDKQFYALSGETAGIKQGERMTLQIRKTKRKGAGNSIAWEPGRIGKDFGACQP